MGWLAHTQVSKCFVAFAASRLVDAGLGAVAAGIDG
jgi:hypothetical protein